MKLRRALMGGLCALVVAGASPSFADVQYAYDSSGRMIRAIYSNGITIEYRYDAAGNRTQIVTSGAAANRAPNARNDSASVAASGYVDIAVLGNDDDPDNNPISITGVSTPTGGSAAVLSPTGSIRYAAPAAAGTYTFTYTISDGTLTSSATVTITVTGAANRPPVAVNDQADTAGGYDMEIYVLSNDSDPDGNTLTVTGIGGADASQVTIAPGGGYVIFSAPLQSRWYSFTYTISDGAGGTATATVDVFVAPPIVWCNPRWEVCEVDPWG